MNTENVTPVDDQGGAAAPVSNENRQVPAKAPTSDAEAAQQQAPAKDEPKAEEAKPEDKGPNRTRQYIDKINEDRRALRNELAQLRAQQEQGQSRPQQPNQAPASGAKEPVLEDFDYDYTEWSKAWNRWDRKNEQQQQHEQQQRTQTREELQQTVDTYEERIAEFAEANPDFAEVVTAIQYPIHQDVQLAIMRHAKGVEISYYLGKNDDEAFNLASVNPALAAQAVERLASRMTAAQNKAPMASEAAPAPTPISLAPKPTKPISNAPAPTPTVSGRSPGEIPPEKMTDDEWYAKDRERRRKR